MIYKHAVKAYGKYYYAGEKVPEEAVPEKEKADDSKTQKNSKQSGKASQEEKA